MWVIVSKKKLKKMEVKSVVTEIKTEEEEDAHAKLEMWKYVLGFTPTAIVKCAVELQISDVLESRGGAMTLTELSAALACSPYVLYRIMRYLMHHGFFKQDLSSPVRYLQTPLSRLLMKTGVNSMSDLVLLESSQVMLAPWHNLRSRTLIDDHVSAFQSANGEDLWKYTTSNPAHSKLFDDGLACHARIEMSAIVNQYPEAFRGIASVVDVGGGNGTALCTLVQAFPLICGINFDLPHVVSAAPHCDGVEQVSGDMFKSVPKADAAFLMHVLHDWNDEECIDILRNCRKAVPKDGGKVIIAEAVIGGGDDKYTSVHLALDMVMLAHTETGKERTLKEWEYVLNAAGFTRYTVKYIEALVAVIEAYP